ncbi:unnamed protein product [Vitrella brassicaformis CCMP3155]|uniref:Uncharacterized protein n=1 Tax=Vitrella brassicaformis (strain CCMP3155) TaxID=1169540 RepID=A0A0G4G8Z6_VITBC|nr:unnamed protein product [Vitrella brassicaformis CCMP3155]|eukprot:CEM25237.1 unnamed protein product [Vitrella brassicaformis CCMP3155]
MVSATRPAESLEYRSESEAEGDAEGGTGDKDASPQEADMWGFLVLRIGCVTFWLTDYPMRHFLLIIGLVLIYAVYW